jgi:membrane-bound metal-dependent hydrolase YbcI (DUF457 family)
MGVGHLAVGFASKKWAPRASLGWLMLAPIFVDVWWGLFILTGVERARITPGITKSIPIDLEYIPWSHSLVTNVGWALLLAGIYFALRKDRRAAAVLFLGVMSHWLLDFVSHRADMPILPSGPLVGLGLWNHPLAAFSVEAALLALGIWLYVGSTRPVRGGKAGLAILIAVLFAANAGAYFGPPPPSITPMAVANLSTLILVWICWRIDGRREPVTA